MVVKGKFESKSAINHNPCDGQSKQKLVIGANADFYKISKMFSFETALIAVETIPKKFT